MIPSPAPAPSSVRDPDSSGSLGWGRAAGDTRAAVFAPTTQLWASSWPCVLYFVASRVPFSQVVPVDPLGRGIWEKAPQEQLQILPSPGGEERRSLASSHNFRGSPVNFLPRTGVSRAKPHARLSPTSGSTQSSRVPGGGVTSWFRFWLQRPAPVPVAVLLPAGPTAAVAAAFKYLIKAPRAGGGEPTGLAPWSGPGARGTTGCAGQRAGGCAWALLLLRRRRRRRGPGAPGCALRPGQTLFSSSVELRLVKRRRPPPPSPVSPALPIPVRGGRLKGTPRLFLAQALPPGDRGVPGTPRFPGPCTPHSSPRSLDIVPRALCPPGAPWAGRPRLRGVFQPQPQRTPRPAPPAETPAVRAGVGGSE
ncbi:hypothetical protein P7K49_021971 [Saguinus oedipus]|uniref:Uncharacterized protein n=1 Tax=Saguinus oedipus TaxID=9490 RepID=A0ABQ9UU36_SAGOE|nr:hypothetical protein P7K49_021971 [Saguinus oedipus]